MGMTGKFLSCLKGVKDPFGAQEGRWDFSRAAAGNLGFLSRYDGDLRDPLMLPQKSPVYMRVVRALSGFLS